MWIWGSIRKSCNLSASCYKEEWKCAFVICLNCLELKRGSWTWQQLEWEKTSYKDKVKGNKIIDIWLWKELLGSEKEKWDSNKTKWGTVKLKILDLKINCIRYSSFHNYNGIITFPPHVKVISLRSRLSYSFLPSLW